MALEDTGAAIELLQTYLQTIPEGTVVLLDTQAPPTAQLGERTHSSNQRFL